MSRSGLDSQDYEMIGLRSALRTATADDNHIAELEAMLSAGSRNAFALASILHPDISGWLNPKVSGAVSAASYR